MSKKDLISYIRKSHLRAVEKFNAELEAWEKETGEKPVTLYEDANTSFTLSDVAVSNDGQLFYTYDGQVEFEVIVRKDEETGEYCEDDGMDGIMEYVKFWRACLRRAKRYWAMDSEKLDAIQDGEAEDDEEDGEDGGETAAREQEAGEGSGQEAGEAGEQEADSQEGGSNGQ